MTRYRPCRYCGQPLKIVTVYGSETPFREYFDDLPDELVPHNCIAKSRKSPRHPETLRDIEKHFLEQETAE